MSRPQSVAGLLLCFVLAGGCAGAPQGALRGETLDVSDVQRRQALAFSPDLAGRALQAERLWAGAEQGERKSARRLAETLWAAAIVEADRVAVERARRELESRRLQAVEQQAAARAELATLQAEQMMMAESRVQLKAVQVAYGSFAACAVRSPKAARCAGMSAEAEQTLLGQMRLWVSLCRLLGTGDHSTQALGEEIAALGADRAGGVGGLRFAQLESAVRRAESCLGEVQAQLVSSAELKARSALEAALIRGLSAAVTDDGLWVTWPAQPEATATAAYAIAGLTRLFPQASSELVLAMPRAAARGENGEGGDDRSRAEYERRRMRAQAAQRQLIKYGVNSVLMEPPAEATSPGLHFRLSLSVEGTGGADG